MNSWWSFYPPGWFPHLRRALERRPRAVSGLSKAQCLPSAALGMGWNMLKPTVVPWWSWWTWTSKKMLVHVCSLYGIFIIVHSPKEICLRFWSIHSSLSLSLLLWLAVTCSAARLNCCAFSGCWHRSKWRFNLWGWQLKAPQIVGDRSLALWSGTSEPCGYDSNHCKTTSWEVPNNYVKSQFFNAFVMLCKRSYTDAIWTLTSLKIKHNCT